MNIASWNINSIRARETSLQKWIVESNPDIIGLQETKVIDDQFPVEFFYDNGFDVRFFGQKSYNGVCLAFKRGSLIKCEQVCDRQRGIEKLFPLKQGAFGTIRNCKRTIWLRYS